jgi:hypothetical protein
MKKRIFLWVALILLVPVRNYGMQKLNKNIFEKTNKIKWNKVPLKRPAKIGQKNDVGMKITQKKIVTRQIPLNVSVATRMPTASKKLFAISSDNVQEASPSTAGTVVVTIRNSEWSEIVEPVPEIIKRFLKRGAKTPKKNVDTASKNNPFDVNNRTSFAQSYFENTRQNGLPYWKLLAGVVAAALLLDKATSSSFFDCALDGELASTMTPDEFVKLLHAKGLTVADAVRIQCEKKEQKAYQAIRDKAQLSELEWKLLQNMMNLKNEWLEENKGSGHYDESNVIFENEFDSQVIKMVKSALQKADIPFKVVVKSVYHDTAYALVRCDVKDFTFEYNVQNGTSKFVESNITTYLILNSSYWNLGQESLVQEALLAHEAVHLAYLHMIEELGFRLYFKNIKKINASELKKCLTIKQTLQEYQADILPLADPGYAKAQQYTYRHVYRSGIPEFLLDFSYYIWSFVGVPRPDAEDRPAIYIPTKKLHALATRAVALHEAEQRLFVLSAPIKGDVE